MTALNVKQCLGAILGVMVLCTVIIGWSKWTLLDSIEEQYARSYQSLVPNKIYSGSMDDEVVQFIVGKISHELSVVNVHSTLTVLNQCQVTEITATAELREDSQWWKRLFFSLVLADPYHHLSYTGNLHCSVNWSVLGASQGIVVVLFLMLLRFMPAPLCRHTSALISRFELLGFSQEQARQITLLSESTQTVIATLRQHPTLANITPENLLALINAHQIKEISHRELAWLVLLYQRHKNEEQAFLYVSEHAEQLEFCIEQRLLKIKGVEIKLTPTPYYYYLWYVQKRLEAEEGWVLNPLTTKADTELAAELITLMQQHGGHAKAINDLARNGLTAKKLDQNRNKIKDEMIAVLGEELAQPYLFEGRREPTSQRYLYRIYAPREKLKIN